ncbi:uncharacterized protein F5147DRAFT_767293 [Suillus discolor]|uniref:Uncharacterized protein n=1 Tax=Suillus discolor TaxID=1912936 RepID=A0A9P7K0J4_9AGAM|nr:uncharacterized protein F5147DRAFT_767293 [Suillus discolor]KAG2119824.1 hypothetical protein F5147DRAFT_767293 [Suillus discolor]
MPLDDFLSDMDTRTDNTLPIENVGLAGYVQQTRDTIFALQGYFSGTIPDASSITNASPPITDASLTTNASPCIADASAPLGNVYETPSDPLLNANPSAFDPYPLTTNLDLMCPFKDLDFTFSTAEPSTRSVDVSIDTFPDLAQSVHFGTDSIMRLPNPRFHVPIDESINTSPDLAHSDMAVPLINTSPDLAHSDTEMPLTNGETAASDQDESVVPPARAHRKSCPVGGQQSRTKDAAAPEGLRLRRNRVAFNP